MHASTLWILPLIAIWGVAVEPLIASDRVKITNGILETTAAPREGVRSFKGIPFGQPPVGDLRWRELSKIKNWRRRP